jgi:predicted ATPase
MARPTAGRVFLGGNVEFPAPGMRGRDEEWRVICELLRGAERGCGGVLLVDGEWGMGKSLLISECRRKAAAEGFSLATAAAGRPSQMVPFDALLAALNEPFDELAAEDRPDSLERRAGRLRERLEQRAAAAPVLVCLDDLQRASPATLLGLRTTLLALRPLPRYPVAWILARAITWPDNHTGQLFTSLERDGATRIRLGPLGGEAVARLLTEAFGAPPDQSLLALAGGAAGNPSLLAELIEGLRADNAVQVTGGRASLISAQLPQRMHLVAQRRLDVLSRRARRLLVTAAALGRSFRLEDVAGMLGDTPAGLLPAIEETVAAGIMTAAEGTFSFRHELIRRAMTHMIPARRTRTTATAVARQARPPSRQT